MKLQLITLLCLIALTFEACKEEPIIKQNDSNYFMFGTYYGQCFGVNCVTIYKLEEGKLFKNVAKERSYSDFFEGKLTYTALTQTEYDLVSDIETKIPEVLLNNTKTTIGCPDCADGGGIYVEYCKNGIKQHWYIDTQKFYVPEELHPFIDLIWEKMTLLE